MQPRHASPSPQGGKLVQIANSWRGLYSVDVLIDEVWILTKRGSLGAGEPPTPGTSSRLAQNILGGHDQIFCVAAAISNTCVFFGTTRARRRKGYVETTSPARQRG